MKTEIIQQYEKETEAKIEWAFFSKFAPSKIFDKMESAQSATYTITQKFISEMIEKKCDRKISLSERNEYDETRLEIIRKSQNELTEKIAEARKRAEA